MIPEYLIIEEIKRREKTAWEPKPLHLPLYAPHRYEKKQKEEETAEESNHSGVIIIKM